MKQTFLMYTFSCLLTIHRSDVILNAPFTADPQILGWTFAGPSGFGIANNYFECMGMGTTQCVMMKDQSQMYKFVSTIGYDNIQLKYSANISEEVSGGDECRIYYSIDSSINWGTPLRTITTHLYDPYYIVPLPTASDNIGVGINFESYLDGSSNWERCFFFNITLSGDAMPTISPSSPPSYTPTTASPTTTLPTTTLPTTTSPTTTSPTTTLPTTTSPTTTLPTTTLPTTTLPTTTFPTTISPTTTNSSTGEPATFNPTTYAPTTDQPSTSVPITEEPTTSGATTIYPTKQPTIKRTMATIDFTITISSHSNISIDLTKVLTIVNHTLNAHLSSSYHLMSDTITVDSNTITILVSAEHENSVVDYNEIQEEIEKDLNKEYDDKSVFVVQITVQNVSHHDKQNILDKYELIMLIVMMVLVVIVIISYIYSKFISFNDFFRVGALITASLHIMDALSDVLFSVNIQHTPILIISFAFIILPILLTLYQLYHAINKWKRFDELGQWISDNVQFLYIISAMTGSSFAGIAVCTSNAFNLTQTAMPLNKTQFAHFQTKRMYSTVLVENIPQVALQILLVVSFGGGGDIVYISMAFSALSIVISVLSTVSQRNIIRCRDYVSVEFDVTGPIIVNNMNSCRNNVKHLQIQIASLLGVNKNLIEITRPEIIKKGLKVRANIFINNVKAIDMDIEKEINRSNQSGELADIIKISWILSNIPLIGNIKYSKYESKERRDNKVIIKAPSEGIQSKEGQTTEIMMSRVISTSDTYKKQQMPPKIPSVLITAGDTFNEEDSDDEYNKDKPSGFTTKGN